jgi:hypothetical protein
LISQLLKLRDEDFLTTCQSGFRSIPLTIAHLDNKRVLIRLRFGPVVGLRVMWNLCRKDAG